MSLKEELYSAIKRYEGQVYSFQQVESICKYNGYKVSNAERRLRELCADGDIEPVFHEKGYINGYRFKKQEKSGQLLMV